MRSACKSVLATMNSMPSTPASIMRLTALPPPPPTPITLILASLSGSSLKLMRMLESFVIYFPLKSSFVSSELPVASTQFADRKPSCLKRFFLPTGNWALATVFTQLAMPSISIPTDQPETHAPPARAVRNSPCQALSQIPAQLALPAFSPAA